MNSLNVDLSHSLCLNIDALEKLPEHKKTIFIHEWLRFLEKVLAAARKTDIKDKQDTILEQLLSQMSTVHGFTARHTLAVCLTSLFLVGDTTKLFDVMNRLTDVIKTNDTSASFISRRLAAICCIGIICQRLGRMVGRSYESAVSSLIKGFKTAESQTRCESLMAFGRIISGLGNVASNVQRDIVKIARNAVTDRVVPVRIAAIVCLKVMAEGLPYVPAGANPELDAIVQQTSRAVILEPGTTTGAVGSICAGFAELQRSTAELLSYLLREAGVQPMSNLAKTSTSIKNPSLSPEDALLILGNLFTRGTASSAASALRASDLLTCRPVAVPHEMRYQLAHAYVEFIRLQGSRWLSQHLPQYLDHVAMICGSATRSALNSENAHQQHIDLLAVRRCILHVFSSTTGLMLSEHSQIAALLHLSNYVLRHLSISKNEISSDGAARDASMDTASVVVVSPSAGQTPSNIAPQSAATPEVPTARRHQEQEQHLVHTIVCSLLHMSSLTTLVGDAIVLNPSLFSLTNRQSVILEAIFASLAHSSNSVRTSACLCLRAIGLAYPPALAPLLDRCAAVLRDSHDVQLSPEVVFGFGSAIASLIAAAAVPDESSRTGSSSPDEANPTKMCGLSPSHIRRMFELAVHMLHCVPLTLRLSEARASVAYLILGGIVRHSSLAVRPLLPRLLALCLRVFPKNNPAASSANSEDPANQANGNAFTWQVMMEARTVVLHVLEILVSRWPYLFPISSEPTQSSIGTTSTDLYLKLLALVHRAVVFIDQLPNISRTHGNSVKVSAAAFRSRLYSLLCTVLLSPTNGTPSTAVSGLISSPAGLLREAVADLTLVEPVGYKMASAAPILFASLGQHHLNLLLTLGPSSTVVLDFPIALEHDPTILISQSIDLPALVASTWQVGQTPRSTNLVCNATRLLATILPSLPAKHRLQIVNHFGEAIKQSKAGQLQQQAIQCNLLAVLILYFRNTSHPSQYPHEWLTNVSTLLNDAIESRIPIIRSAGAEALGRLAAAVGDRFAADLRQSTTDRLRTSRDMNTRICQSLALGAILSQCGSNQTSGGVLSVNALQHCIGLLLGLAQDHTANSVQAAALHALAAVLDANGPLIRTYAESLVTVLVTVLLNSLGTSGTVQGSSHLPQLAARCLNAIITTLGPELAANTGVMDEARSCILTALSALMATEKGSKLSPEIAYAQAEALACFQQLHLYAPRHVSLLTLVPKLFEILHLTQQQVDALEDWSSCTAVAIKSQPLVILRRAAAGCLRQLAQREPLDLIEHAIRLCAENSKLELEGQLFSLLDIETDTQLRNDIHETLISLLQTVGAARLTVWLQLIRDVLSKTSADPGAPSGGQQNASTPKQPSTSKKSKKGGLADDDEESEEETEEAASFGPVVTEDPNPPILPRWRTRVFAVNCLTRLIDSCHATGDARHFDLTMARQTGDKTWIILHLADIVRLVSLAATHPCLNVRLAGLHAMRSMICHFADSQDPELPGSSLLEQYQAQMGASLRPAFAVDAPAYITADACDVCSAWMASGITREPADLMRIHILLVGMLNRLEQPEAKSGKQQINQIGYTQATEIFGVLRAWAEVYVEADSREQLRMSNMKRDNDSIDEYATSSSGESLVSLVAPNLDLLGPLWLLVLRDYALLTFVNTTNSQPSFENSAKGCTSSLSYLTENLDPPDASRLCQAAFPAVVQASSLWLISLNRSSASPMPENGNENVQSPDSSLILLLGACAGTLCERLNIDPPNTLIACLRALTRLFSSNWAASRISEDFVVVRELLQITYRLLLVRELTMKLQPAVVGLASTVAKSLTLCSRRNLEKSSSFTTSTPGMTASPSLLGLTLVGSKMDSSQSGSSNQFSGDIVVAERVLLAIAHRVLSPQQNPSVQNPLDMASLSILVLELLGSLPSLAQCHVTTTPSIFALMTRSIQAAAYHPEFPKNIVGILSSTTTRLISVVADHGADEPLNPLVSSMIWRLVDQLLSTLTTSQQIAPSAAIVILVDCILVPLSTFCPPGTSKPPETQFEQIKKMSLDIVNLCIKSKNPGDIVIVFAALKRLVMSIDATASPRGGSPFAAELIAAVISSAMHSLSVIVLNGASLDTSLIKGSDKSLTPAGILTIAIGLIRAMIDFLTASGSKNRYELLEVALRIFVRAALNLSQSSSTKTLVPILTECINALISSNQTEMKQILAQSPSLKQQLQEVIKTGSSVQSAATLRQTGNSASGENLSSQQKINLKMDFSHFSASNGSFVKSIDVTNQSVEPPPQPQITSDDSVVAENSVPEFADFENFASFDNVGLSSTAAEDHFGESQTFTVEFPSASQVDDPREAIGTECSAAIPLQIEFPPEVPPDGFELSSNEVSANDTELPPATPVDLIAEPLDFNAEAHDEKGFESNLNVVTTFSSAEAVRFAVSEAFTDELEPPPCGVNEPIDPHSDCESS